jgi:hypothetical protein
MSDRGPKLPIHRYYLSAFAAAAVHASAFVAFLVYVAPSSVRATSWLALYLLGGSFLWLRPRLLPTANSFKLWASTLMYAALLAILFFGADLALSVLGNSVKPRSQLPAFLGGLEMHFVLVPGIASVALGELARRCVVVFFSFGKGSKA